MTEQIGTLNTLQIREKHRITNEYRDFWQTHQHSKVDDDLIELLFERAAEITVRVEEEDRLLKCIEEEEEGNNETTETEKAAAGSRKAGSSEALFWDVESVNPSKDPATFVRSLVLSTLKDSEIPEERVDAFITKFDTLYPMDKWLNHEVTFGPAMAEKFAELAVEVSEKAAKLHAAVAAAKNPVSYHTDRDFSFVIESLLAQLTSISEELDVQLAPTPALTPKKPEVAATAEKSGDNTAVETPDKMDVEASTGEEKEEPMEVTEEEEEEEESGETPKPVQKVQKNTPKGKQQKKGPQPHQKNQKGKQKTNAKQQQQHQQQQQQHQKPHAKNAPNAKIEAKREEKEDSKVDVKEEDRKKKAPQTSPVATSEEASTKMDVEEKTDAATTTAAVTGEEEKAKKEEEGEEQQQQQVEVEVADPEAEKKKAEEEEKKPIEDLTTQGTLKIENIAGNVAKLRPQIDEFKKSTDLLDLNSLTKNPIDGVKAVEKMQKKCREYSEYLMRDLLTLDEIAGTEAIRPIRKARVGEIQQLMDRMDEISHHLTKIHTDLEKDAKAAQDKLDAEAAKKREEEEAKKKAEQEQLEARRKQVMEDAGKVAWDQLRLEPKFHAQEASGSYIISASIPGMNTKDIGLRMTDGGNVLEISGTRRPTEEEISKLANILETNPRFAARYANTSKPDAMLSLGKGKFGKFVKRFEIPEDALTERMSASYDNGILKVVIPRMARNRGFFPSYDYDSFW